jgi:hypothetical protein
MSDRDTSRTPSFGSARVEPKGMRFRIMLSAITASPSAIEFTLRCLPRVRPVLGRAPTSVTRFPETEITR